MTPSQFVESWKLISGREKFTLKIYKFAMRNTLLGNYFDDVPFSEFEQELVHQ